jgi:hypothetical protein
MLSHPQPRGQLERVPRYSILACVSRHHLPCQSATHREASFIIFLALNAWLSARKKRKHPDVCASKPFVSTRLISDTSHFQLSGDPRITALYLAEAKDSVIVELFLAPVDSLHVAATNGRHLFCFFNACPPTRN